MTHDPARVAALSDALMETIMEVYRDPETGVAVIGNVEASDALVTVCAGIVAFSSRAETPTKRRELAEEFKKLFLRRLNESRRTVDSVDRSRVATGSGMLQ